MSRGWAVTCAFYSAVHFVRGYLLARHGVTVSSHEQMHGLWFKYPEIRTLKREYEALKNRSELHRYYLVEFTPDQLEEARAPLRKIRSMLEAKIERALSASP